MKKRKAIIDIGTNSIKFCIAEVRCQTGKCENIASIDLQPEFSDVSCRLDKKTGDHFKIIKEEIDITRLGEGLNENGTINDKALKRNSDAIKKFVEISREYDADISVIGTMALRCARNASEFISIIKKLCGVDICVISGEEEAKLAFEAASQLAEGKNCAVFDTGGGSTELIWGECEKQSIAIGAVNLKERYFNTDHVVGLDSLKSAYSEIEESLKKLAIPTQDSILIGVGGAATTIASVKLGLAQYDEKAVNGLIISADDVDAQIKLYSETELHERITIPGLHPKRADIILAGCCIIRSLMRLLGKESFIVSANGIRHAIIQYYFNGLLYSEAKL